MNPYRGRMFILFFSIKTWVRVMPLSGFDVASLSLARETKQPIV